MIFSIKYKPVLGVSMFRIIFISAFLGVPLTAVAAIHEVMVLDPAEFSPAELTVEVGDTVRWINPDGGEIHNVHADNDSFESELASGFVFEQTFNAVGQIPYHCHPHRIPANEGEMPQLGVINVKAAASSGFTMNAGLNDAWFNPATDGQGFFITVFPDLGFVNLAWFTYDTELPSMDATANLGDPGHRWLTAGGLVVENRAILDIEFASGGLFDSASEIQRTDPVGSDGKLTLTFEDCSSGTVEYDITSINVQGTIPIQRVATDNVALCEALLTE